MKINVTLDKEQMDEIASITADKVLATVKYQKIMMTGTPRK